MEKRARVMILANTDERKMFLYRHEKWNDVQNESKMEFTLKRQYKISSECFFLLCKSVKCLLN